MMVLSVNAKQNVVFSARANIIFVMMIAFFQFIHKIRKQRTFLLTSDFNSGSGFSVVVAAAADDTDADADDAASGAALFVVVVFSAVSASAATLTALITLLDFCLNDVVVLFVPPLRDAVA